MFGGRVNFSALVGVLVPVFAPLDQLYMLERWKRMTMGKFAFDILQLFILISYIFANQCPTGFRETSLCLNTDL